LDHTPKQFTGSIFDLTGCSNGDPEDLSPFNAAANDVVRAAIRSEGLTGMHLKG
jgi:hypothetical protein